MSSRHWIELARVHTAGLTTALFVGGYLLAGGTILSIPFLLWFLCGVFYHICGFIHNNIADLPYDLADPRKKHFPLVSGAIEFRKADEINRFLMILFCFYALYLTRLQPVPTFFLFIAISGGLLYDYFSKVTPLAVPGVATAWGILPIISYSSTTSSFGPVITWVTIYSWVQVFVQISVLGFIKDMEAPKENNLMRKLGCRVDGDKFFCSLKAFSYATLLKGFHMFLLIPVLLSANSSHLAWVLSVAFFLISYFPYQKLMSLEWERDKVLGRCVLNEAFAFFAVMPAIQGVIGWENVILLLVYPPVWVFTWMRLQWGSWRLGPKV
jgi:hypothetical protein